MTSLLYQECHARAQELRGRLDRMQQWFDTAADSAPEEELRWRRERFDEAQREYAELLVIMRTYGKTPVGGASESRGTGDLGFDSTE